MDMRPRYIALTAAIISVVLVLNQHLSACDRQPVHFKAEEMSKRIEERAPLVLQGHNVRIAGSIELLVVVGPNGAPSCISVIRGHPILTATAIGSVKDWRFRPYRAKGKSVSYSGPLIIRAKDFRH